MEEVPAEALPGWSSCTDAELVKAYLASSDRRVFAEIVRRHAGMVMAVCRRATLQESDAEDAFQATFLILARSARKIRRRASLASWLYGVAQRTAIRSRRMREPSFSSLDLAEPPAPQDLFSELANQHEAEQVDAVLAELPEVYREPLLLFHLEGLSVREIAERLASTAGSIEGRLKRGRLQLKRKLLKAGISLPAFLVSLQALHSEAIASEPVVEALLEPTLAMATGVEGASCSPIIDSLIQQELIPMVFKSPTLISLGGATTTVALLLAGTVTLMSGHSSVVADDGKDPTVGSTEVSLEEGAAESPNVRAPGSDKKKGKDPFFSVASGSDKGESSGFAGDGGEYPDGLSTPPRHGRGNFTGIPESDQCGASF